MRVASSPIVETVALPMLRTVYRTRADRFIQPPTLWGEPVVRPGEAASVAMGGTAMSDAQGATTGDFTAEVSSSATGGAGGTYPQGIDFAVEMVATPLLRQPAAITDLVQ